MSIYSGPRRLFYSLAMAALLATVYVGFRIASDVFLDVERAAPRHSHLRQSDNGGNEAIQLARTWFGHAPWVGESRKQFYDEGRYLYCRDFSLINNDRSLKISPIAMLWQSGDEDSDPVTLVADRAQLSTTEPLSLNSSKFGGIVGGFISGNVQIQGPDGLRISGRTFQLDRDSMKLFSSDPVQFQYKTHEGVASGGVDVFLTAAADSDGGLKDVDHVSQVQLLGQVKCHLFEPATKPDREDIQLQVIAAGGLKFDVDMKTCTFSGLSPDGRGVLLNPKEEVWVRRIHPNGDIDQLVCPELQLHFRNEVDSTTGQPIEDKLALERMTAWGRSVTVVSRANNLTMQGTELHYSLDEGRFDLKHSDLDTSGKRQMVQVIRDGMTLEAHHVRVLMADQQEPQRIECLGGGRMFGEIPDQKSDSKTRASKKEDVPGRFRVSWEEQLTFKKISVEAWLVDILGNAIVQESSRQFQLKGQQIQVRLEQPPTATEDASQLQESVLQVSHSAGKRPPETKEKFDLPSLVPDLLTAAGNVSISTPDGSGTIRDRLVVKISDLPPTLAQATEKQAAPAKPTNTKADGRNEASGVTFATDRLEAVVLRPADGASDQQLQLQTVWLKGDVTMDRKSTNPKKQFAAEGTMLKATGSPDRDLTLMLFGDPAKVSIADRNFEGTRLNLDQIDSNVNAIGSGRIRFYTKKGFDGKLLQKPAPLDIYWSDQMTFEPRSATFVGNIRIAMSDETTQDVELLCSGLKVYFSRDVTIGESDEKGTFQALGKEAEDETELIERIECLNKVNVRVDQYEGDQHVGRHRIEVVDLKLNLQSGEFHAIGPGFLESASPDKKGTLQSASPVSVRPNSAAATSQTAFVYVKANFIGDIHGNMRDRIATLNQNVVALIAPAPRVDEKISLDLVPFDQLPEKAGLLRAQQLTLTITDGDAFSMIARDNARLESQTLSASADVITYDHLKQQFIIRTEGDNEVIALHRSAPGRPPHRLKGKRFEYYRRGNQLKADGIGGLLIDN